MRRRVVEPVATVMGSEGGLKVAEPLAAWATRVVLAVVRQQRSCVAPKVRLAARLADELGCDELDLVEIQLALESEMGTRFLPDDAVAGCRTVGDVVEVVRLSLGERVAG